MKLRRLSYGDHSSRGLPNEGGSSGPMDEGLLLVTSVEAKKIKNRWIIVRRSITSDLLLVLYVGHPEIVDIGANGMAANL